MFKGYGQMDCLLSIKGNLHVRVDAHFTPKPEEPEEEVKNEEPEEETKVPELEEEEEKIEEIKEQIKPKAIFAETENPLIAS